MRAKPRDLWVFFKIFAGRVWVIDWPGVLGFFLLYFCRAIMSVLDGGGSSGGVCWQSMVVSGDRSKSVV